MKCNVCGIDILNLSSLSFHLSVKHNYSKSMIKEYYDKYFKKDGEGRCYFCENEAVFKGMTKGYHRICNSKKCLGKTRATGTYEFLMYKYNLSEEDAIKMMNDRAKDRGKEIKKSLDKKLNDNPNFHKERSHQTIEYWIKRGYSKEESEKKVLEIMNMIHDKTWKKRRENPELYKDILPAQIGYWLKKGFSEEESIQKLKERQNTFTLDKCIVKYGDEEGKKRWLERQEKWSKIMNDKYKNGDYIKANNNMYSKHELKLIKEIVNALNLKDEEYHSSFKDPYIINIEGNIYNYDFVYKNLIIEYQGDYWHCNPIKYDQNYFHNHRKLTAKEIWDYDKKKKILSEKKGYRVLHVWENEYKKNSEQVLQECIDFLKNK